MNTLSISFHDVFLHPPLLKNKKALVYKLVFFRYNFNKVAQYKQLTLEEAEEKMKNRRKFVDGYERWMMKTASNGAAAFPTFDATLVKDIPTGGGGKGRKKSTAEDEGNASDKGEDDPEEEGERKAKVGPSKRAGDDDDEEGPAGGDFDDDDDIEKGKDFVSLFILQFVSGCLCLRVSNHNSYGSSHT